MEDKRIIKTKRNLKSTLINMLKTTPFEKITVSALCKEGETSRITFYTYYNDKYALAAELFNDLFNEAVKDYYNLQSVNNKEKTAIQGYNNMLDCILNLYYNNIEFFSITSPEINPYLYSSFYHHIFSSVENYVEKHKAQMVPKYSSKQTAALLCNGLWGVINECYTIKTPWENIKKDIKEMYRDILLSDIFLKKQ